MKRLFAAVHTHGHGIDAYLFWAEPKLMHQLFVDMDKSDILAIARACEIDFEDGESLEWAEVVQQLKFPDGIPEIK